MKIEQNYRHGNNKLPFLSILVFFYSFIILFTNNLFDLYIFYEVFKVQTHIKFGKLLEHVFVFYYTIQFEQGLIKQK